MAGEREPQHSGSVRPSKSPAEVLAMGKKPNQTGVHLPRCFPSRTASTAARKTPSRPSATHAVNRCLRLAVHGPSRAVPESVWPSCLPGVLGAGSGWLGWATGSSTAQTRTLLGLGGKTPFLMPAPDRDGLGVGRPDACGSADMTGPRTRDGRSEWGYCLEAARKQSLYLQLARTRPAFGHG